MADAASQGVAPGCVACGSRTEAMGTVRPMDSAFARVLHGRPPRMRRALRCCRRCGLEFCWPLPSQEELTQAYGRAPATIWQGRPLRYWSAVRRELVRHSPGRRVLDVGCYRGAFLNALGPEWERFGVEPSQEAASEARRSGVSVVGEGLESLDRMEEEFDAVLMLDLIEHLAAPVTALRHAWRVIRPGGVLLVSTGNADALPWRLYGADYYYCRMPEHMLFFRPRWFRWLCGRAPLELVRVRRFRRELWAPAPWLLWLAGYLAYLPVPMLRRFRLATERGPFTNRYERLVRGLAPRQGGPLRDHMLVLMRKRTREEDTADG